MAQTVRRTGFLCLALASASAAANAATFQTIYSATVNDLGFATPLAVTGGQILATVAGNPQQPFSAKIMLLKPPPGGAGAWSGKTLFNFGNSTSEIYTQPFAVNIAPIGAVGTTNDGLFAPGGGVFDLSASTTPPLTTVHDFTNTSEQSVGPLVKGPGGLFFGLGLGSAFAVDASAIPSSYTVLAKLPVGSVLGSALAPNRTGQLFGTSSYGGVVSGADGSVFELSQTAGQWTAQTIVSFGTGTADFQEPSGTLATDPSGNVYGCATTTDGYGGVFKLSPPAAMGGSWVTSTVYAFRPQAGEPVVTLYGSSTTAAPCTLTVDLASGKIFGVTALGGGASVGNGLGTVFELDPPAAGQTAWTETVLHAFSGAPPDGGYPTGPLVKIGSSYYGASIFGGTPSTSWVWSVTP